MYELCVHACTHVGIRGQLSGTGSLPLQCGSQGWNRSPSSVASAFYPLSCLHGSRICSFKTSVKATFLGNPRVLSSASWMGKVLSVETDWWYLRPEVSIPNSQLGRSSEKVWKRNKDLSQEDLEISDAWVMAHWPFIYRKKDRCSGI